MKKLLLFCLLVGLTSFSASAQYFQWAKKQDNNIPVTSVASGNSLVATTGTFSNTITLGNQTFSTADTMDQYLAVHDHAGNVLWAKHIVTGGILGIQQPCLTFDANQNIIIAGSFIDSLYIDGLIFKGTTGNISGAYVAKFSPTGSLLWARSSDVSVVTGHAAGRSVTTDLQGNVIVAGDFYNSVTFNSTSLTANGSNAAFIVKYDVSGTLQWAVNTLSTTVPENVSKIKATSAGEIYLINFAQGLGAPGASGFPLYKYSAAGILLWNKTINNPTFSYPNLAVDNLDNAYIIGNYHTNITIGNSALTTPQNVSSSFLAKIDAAGNWKWARTIASNLIFGYPYMFHPAPGIVYTNDNELIISGTFSGTTQFNNISITSSRTNGLNTFVAKLDTAGTPIWVNNATSTVANNNTDLSGDNSNNLFLAGSIENGSTQFSGSMLTTSGTASYLAKITHEANIASGTIFLDANSNGIKDASEVPYIQLIIQSTPGPVYGISNLDGTYSMYLPTGASTLSIPSPPPYYTTVPASHSLTFSGANQAQTGKDFALQPIPNSNDVKVTVTALIPARPGFQSKYRLTFHNSGTTTLSDTLKFQHNTSILAFVSASEPTVSNSNGKIAWYYQNLLPNETRNIDVTFLVPTTTVLGTPLKAIASIKPYAIDLLQEDNIDSLHHVVIGSFDPNDKQVDKTTLSPARAATGEYLDYTIRFQNTGTDTAFTVVVTDRILSQLNLATFEMLSASHNYKVNVIDGNMLEWRFDNILLPDSNRNEPASHGFIRFRLKSKAGLQLGDSITNQAAIYFDYNAPVITNHAVTKVANPNGIKEKKASIQAFKLYPNPAKNYVMVNAEFKKNTSATVSLVNLLGQTLSNVTLPANNQIHYQLPLKDLPKGIYLIRLETESGMQTQRLVVQ
ncbi:T9SS type A sorting domain-containing protein [Adhaeribacter sp. BT258]|uniref:T9SS type A sorting domain-containing protein n=1 Tax=Adhaeribacter terrigena TaxID=2793070 RepID=A0ABS1C3T9_9BACT|nr:T9SS type A sorting domain-containing protein [Adhaeribacter terrigena]MBK0404066.1 T9SS type A sorting domain-containing protein [Adhaeribacter terrigena]